MVPETEKLIRVGIMGLGRSGFSIHAKALSKLSDKFRIVAGADLCKDNRTDAEREFGIKSYNDYTELVTAAGIDLIVNALPTPLHVDGTISALEAGYDVVCEKPVAATVKDIDKMEAAAEKNKQLLAPFQQNRLQPFFFKIQEVINSGILGKLIHIRSNWSSFRRRWDWQTLQKNFGGSLYNTGPHAVDQALALMNWPEKPEVFCRMSCNNQLGGDAEDFCALTVYGQDLPTFEIVISAYVSHPEYRYSISGQYGCLWGNEMELKWKYFDPEKAPEQQMWPNWSENRSYPDEKLPWKEKRWSLKNAESANTSGYTLKSLLEGSIHFYDNIYDVLTDNANLLITVPQVRKQIAVIEESHKQNEGNNVLHGICR
jgi:scyllo-inositol 2-dehydrogenase (NADP+)